MPESILLIEDEPAIADTISYALKTEGFLYDWVQLGSEAKAKLAEKSYDLLIMDIGLPDISGFDLLREVRKTINTPVIFLTARSDEIDKIVGLEIGADDYLTKPFSPRELTSRIRAILRRIQKTESSQPAPQIIRTDGEGQPALQREEATQNILTISEDRFQILYRNKPLNLSKNEYRLLKTLIQKPGRIFSRDQLMEAAWDDPLACMDRTVDATIKSIRAECKKICPTLDPIETHRGFGYSLRETVLKEKN